jgi:hypothetical protein
MYSGAFERLNLVPNGSIFHHLPLRMGFSLKFPGMLFCIPKEAAFNYAHSGEIAS